MNEGCINIGDRVNFADVIEDGHIINVASQPDKTANLDMLWSM